MDYMERDKGGVHQVSCTVNWCSILLRDWRPLMDQLHLKYKKENEKQIITKS